MNRGQVVGRKVTINDAVHGHLVLHEVSRLIIDTPEFQRLRNLTQSGINSFVYPTANHTRFEHSIGVAHFAKKFVDCLDYQTCFLHPGEKEINLRGGEGGEESEGSEEGEGGEQSEGEINLRGGEGDRCYCKLKLSRKEKIIVEIAGLCHDLGHGPFSHSWEGFVRRASGQKVEHEELSAMILMRIYHRIIQNEEAKKVLEKFDIKEEDFDFACDIIHCSADKRNSKGKLKQHLFEIIANKSSGIDVDKMEYIIRDAQQFGMHFSVDVTRVMLNARIIKLRNGKTTIAYRDKIHGNIFDIFLTRANMHFLCYQHPTCKRLETMLIDILCEADKHMEVNGLKLSQCHKNLDAYLTLNNSILLQIQHSTQKNLEKAKELIEKLLERKLYTVLLEKVVDPKIKMTEDQEEKIENELELNRITKGLHYRVASVAFKMGEYEKDPLKNVKFFNKDGDLVDYQKMRKSLLSRFYTEASLFVYKAFYVYCTEDKETTKIKEREKNFRYKDAVDEVLMQCLRLC